jgi:hypothetical protein
MDLLDCDNILVCADREGETPIFVALKYSHFDVALILLENSSKHSSPGQRFVSSNVLSDESSDASSTRVNFDERGCKEM